MLMSVVYDLKAKLEMKFGNEFVDKVDELLNVGRLEQTAEERAAVRSAADAEHEAGLNSYLGVEPKKKRKKPTKKQSNKKMLVMKKQDMNLLDENFQLKDPTKRPDRYVMELGSSYYELVGNKSKGILHNSQFETSTKIDLQNLLRAPYHDSYPNQRGIGWAFRAKLEREVKKNLPNMKVVESYLRKNPGVRDPHAK
ncbi:hypothetical protein Hanom_Chr09g00795781 [Helianthus anomalus]